MKPDQVVVSVEHASPRVPAGLDGLGLSARFLASHHGWDPGAAEVGRDLARGIGAPLHLGRWSRLVADLNRSARHPRVIAQTSGYRRIPGNTGLLGAGYPGLFPARDTKALAALLSRAERDRSYYKELRSACRELRGLTSPVTERQAWARLLKEVVR